MRPNAITIFLGLAILEAAGCHPILKPTANNSTNAILNRDGTPAIVSGAPVDTISAVADLLGVAVGKLSPIQKPTIMTMTTITMIPGSNKRDTPTLIGGVLIGARREDFQSPKAEEIMKRESAGHSRAENFSPSLTLDKRDDPDSSNSVLGLWGSY
ncbi:uncharacterized protein Bfra_007868 [Botrytis fragariae]|uniref:Uncharacterized protein n=1 Tax=Botrytis fragariae TaxID=1964551 RepID=A0A8H6EGI5_9HELO|nr:uncharacterized protein Bfra_007868 [Botrytis fragariae]KAF5871353.1 hypothetical protein Bfra_007868 [Botrytis fragariae]